MGLFALAKEASGVGAAVQIRRLENGSYVIETYEILEDWSRELKTTNEYDTEEEALKAYQIEHAFCFGIDSPYWREVFASKTMR